MLSKKDSLAFVTQEGSTCVHIAAMKGSVSVMKELLKFNPSGITTARNKVNGKLILFPYTEVTAILCDAINITTGN